jgi:hypothetical protein
MEPSASAHPLLLMPALQRRQNTARTKVASPLNLPLPLSSDARSLQTRSQISPNCVAFMVLVDVFNVCKTSRPGPR